MPRLTPGRPGAVRSAGRRAALSRLARLGAAAAFAGSGAARAAAAASAPQRLVSVGGALTEIAYALGCEQELVGVDTTSLYPEAATRLPSVGYARSLSAEGILALAPTRLVATEEAGPPAVLRQIADAGVAVNVLPANHRFEGMLDRVRRMGELTGRAQRAGSMAAALQADWARVRRRIEARAAPSPRVLFVLAHSPGQIMVSGRATNADAMIRYAGAANAVQDFDGFKPLGAEALIAARPDIVLLTEQGLKANGGVDRVLALPGLSQTPAGAARRVVALEAMFLLGFGPRMPAALDALDVALNGAQGA
ncbi:heme/hemin ABC transporter substrate-binding protein [Thauera sinica]|uniref:Hemin ABC transporter substrate-binding protein n=1 Tax=Thauera sinica TaxID=2665146 RepID=A0ABW1AUL3_9RHOO|nr:ABC transporter substrate-binding protein [Thauera sp. K11]ATE61905.1 hemin ABC transporter substrate-binding protein [Thauera sp. K11]